MPACATLSTGSKRAGGWRGSRRRCRRYLEMTEIQTRLLAEGGPAVLFENVTRMTGENYPMPVLVNCSAPSSASPGAWTASPADLREIGRTLAFLKQPEPPGGWREALDMLPLAANGHGDAPAHRGRRAVPGDRVARRRDRSRGTAGPDLLAGRAGAADHLAAGGDQGPWRAPRGRLQSRHLPDAGDRPRHHLDALAQASRRRPASSALGHRASRAVAGGGGDRRRSGHDPRRGHAGSGHACRNTSSPGCCAAARSNWSIARPCR